MPATAAPPEAAPALSPAARALLAEALALPEADRVALAGRLREPVRDEPSAGERPEFSAAERAELERRVEDCHTGREVGEPWPEVRARAHALIAELSAEERERAGGNADGAAA